MSLRIHATLNVMLLALIWFGAVPATAMAAAGEDCRDQAAVAEREAGIPAGLLLAIGKRESGRTDPQSGSVLPWPWAVNREGEDHVFETRDDAVAYVDAAERDGSRSIDVGCFQINLKFHPDAFGSLIEAFDPAANARYAAHFLADLHERTGSWETAVAWYHSATAERGEPYRDAVLATWRGLAEPQSLGAPSAGGPARIERGVKIFFGGPAPAPTPPHVSATEPPADGRSVLAPAATIQASVIRIGPPRRFAGLPVVIRPGSPIPVR